MSYRSNEYALHEQLDAIRRERDQLQADLHKERTKRSAISRIKAAVGNFVHRAGLHVIFNLNEYLIALFIIFTISMCCWQGAEQKEERRRMAQEMLENLGATSYDCDHIEHEYAVCTFQFENKQSKTRICFYDKGCVE